MPRGLNSVRSQPIVPASARPPVSTQPAQSEQAPALPLDVLLTADTPKTSKSSKLSLQATLTPQNGIYTFGSVAAVWMELPELGDYSPKHIKVVRHAVNVTLRTNEQLHDFLVSHPAKRLPALLLQPSAAPAIAAL